MSERSERRNRLDPGTHAAGLRGLAPFAGLLALAVVAGCGGEAPATDQMPEASAPAAMSMMDTLYTTDVQAGDSAMAPVSGKVDVIATGAGEPLELTIAGSGLTPGEHAWHIHAGSCAMSGEVQIPLSATADMAAITGPLMVDDAGTFKTTITIPQLTRDELGKGEHSLHIHVRSGVDHGPTVACATI